LKDPLIHRIQSREEKHAGKGYEREKKKRKKPVLILKKKFPMTLEIREKISKGRYKTGERGKNASECRRAREEG